MTSRDPTTTQNTVALDTTTGLVHQYQGTYPGGIGSDDMGCVGVIPCGCDGEHADIFAESLKNDCVVMVDERRLAVGVWDAAPCLRDGEEIAEEL